MLKIGVVKMHSKLMQIDPIFAANIHPTDSYRISRGYGIFLQTGMQLSSFFTGNKFDPLKHYSKKVIMLLPERGFLYQNCNKRFMDMMSNGILDEVKNAYNYYGSHLLKENRIIGVREICDYIEGKISYHEAICTSQKRTRNYAKRQITWFSNKIINKEVYQFSTYEQFQQLCDTQSLRFLAKNCV